VTSLREILHRYPTDKDTDHSYGPIYEALLEPRRADVRRVLEIGIGGGASLRAWRDFFPNASVVGLDCRAECIFHEPRISTFQGQQADPACLEALARQGPWNLIVDDGSHRLEDQLASLLGLWSSLQAGGLYSIEDVQNPAWLEVLAALPGAVIYDLRAQKGRHDDILVILTKPAEEVEDFAQPLPPSEGVALEPSG
jgi:demethylmacrocin O-methyltransferase